MSSPSKTILLQNNFRTTRWTRVRLAKLESEDGRRALAELCETYYEPVIAFLRCQTRDTDAAREMAHEFFARLLKGGGIQGAERERGRFRSYLLGAVKHFVSNHREAAQRLKRGGDAEHVSMNDTEVGAVPDPKQISPDAAFDRQWALTVLSRALQALRTECAAQGKETFFEKVKPLFTGEAAHGEQLARAEACGMNLSAFRMAVHRLKRRFRDCVKEEIAGTLEDNGMIGEEMETLFAALAS